MRPGVGRRGAGYSWEDASRKSKEHIITQERTDAGRLSRIYVRGICLSQLHRPKATDSFGATSKTNLIHSTTIHVHYAHRSFEVVSTRITRLMKSYGACAWSANRFYIVNIVTIQCTSNWSQQSLHEATYLNKQDQTRHNAKKATDHCPAHDDDELPVVMAMFL